MASHGVSRAAATRVKDEVARQREQKEISSYNSLVELVNKKAAEHDTSSEALSHTSKLLQQNPEYYTIWNQRRKILQSQFSSSNPTPEAPLSASETAQTPIPAPAPRIRQLITDDLQFLIPILIQYPKCYWLWNHRLWLLEQSNKLLPLDVAKQLWQEELGLVSKMLNRDRRNFHGWGYRRRVISSLESLQALEGNTRDETQGKSLVEQEFDYTTKMISSDLSNFSAWHNRSKLIPRLLDEREADESARRKMLDQEFELAQNALLDPVDQSPWFYHQFLVSTLHPNNPRHSAIMIHVSNEVRLHYLEQEIDAIKEMLEDSSDCKWVYQALLTYAELYFDIDAGNNFLTTKEMRGWLDMLRTLDPARNGKWDDWEKKLDL